MLQKEKSKITKYSCFNYFSSSRIFKFPGYIHFLISKCSKGRDCFKNSSKKLQGIFDISNFGYFFTLPYFKGALIVRVSYLNQVTYHIIRTIWTKAIAKNIKEFVTFCIGKFLSISNLQSVWGNINYKAGISLKRFKKYIVTKNM